MVDESFREGKKLAVLEVSCQQSLEVFIFWLISKCDLEPAGSETGRAGEVSVCGKEKGVVQRELKALWQVLGSRRSREHWSEVTTLGKKDWKTAVKSRNLLALSHLATCLQEVLKFSLACLSLFFCLFHKLYKKVLFQWFRSQSRSYFETFWYFPLEFSVNSCR